MIVVSIGAVARGQDDDDAEQACRGITRQDFREDLIQLQRQRRLAEFKKQLERRIAVSAGAGVELRVHFETRLEGRLNALQSTCHLTEAQRKKLQLAGRGDIKRFMDRLDPIVKDSVHTTAVEMQELTAKMRDLQNTADGLFDAGSLFSKTLVTTLSQEQVAENERALRDENSAWYRNGVANTVRMLARLADLSDAQSEKLSKLILTETTPPLKFGLADYDYAVVMFQASRLPEAKLQEIFDEGAVENARDARSHPGPIPRAS